MQTHFVFVGNVSFVSFESDVFLDEKICKRQNKQLATFAFDDTNIVDFSKLAQAIKWGILVDYKTLVQYIEDKGVQILGVHKKDEGMFCKKDISTVRRFKLVEPLHKDKEIVQTGVECFCFDKEKNIWGIVQGWQDIGLLESVDFEKPARSMQMGMMPAKLACLLISIGKNYAQKSNPTIYDPFCGSGTTLFLANAFGYNCIGSDANIHLVKENITRRRQTQYNTESLITIFKRDVTTDDCKKLVGHADIVCTEGYLGPIVTRKTSRKQCAFYATEVIDLRDNFFAHWSPIAKDETYIIATLPHYITYGMSIYQDFSDMVAKYGRKAQAVPQIYMREKQQVGREIVIVSKQ